jgi:sortase A
VEPVPPIGPIRQAPRYRWSGVWLERTAWVFGLVCLVTCGALYIDGVAGTRRELERFAVLRAAAQAAAAQQTAAADLSLWDTERIDAWRRALNEPAPPPIAVLRIPKIRLEVPVLPGTDDSTLNRSVGHIENTALPGTDGNSGIAGHRDGFFRGLKDIGPDDAIELETLRGKEVYRVERTWVVDPEDVSVLDPTPTRSLTLVTCYPFYHVGPAPQRFIVRAVRADKAAAVHRGIEQAPCAGAPKIDSGQCAQRRRSDDHGN